MSDNNYDPIQPKRKNNFFKEAILGNDEEYEEYLRNQKATSNWNSKNKTTINNLTYNNNTVKHTNETGNYNGTTSNSSVTLKTNDLFITYVIALMCVLAVTLAARLMVPDFSEYMYGSESDDYEVGFEENLTEEEKYTITNNGGIMNDYTYNETIDWGDGDVSVEIPTYYSFSGDTDIVSSALYSPDNRFPAKNSVFDVEIEYNSLNSIALTNYEEHLTLNEGYTNVLHDGNKTIFVKALGFNKYAFVIREYGIFTYGFCLENYKSALGVNLTIDK